jgi:hypothetical protein
MLDPDAISKDQYAPSGAEITVPAPEPTNRAPEPSLICASR